MILTCPNCGTQYVVKDGAIPLGGRQVRCAACKHSWHQDPAEMTAEPSTAPGSDIHAEGAEEFQAEPQPSVSEDESVTGAVLMEPRSGPEAEERAYEEAAIQEEPAAPEAVAAEAPEAAESASPVAAAAADWDEPPQAERGGDEFSPFPPADEDEPRRRGPLLTIVIVAILIVAVAAAFWFFAPGEWKTRLGLAAVSSSPLELVTTHMDRQRLESGNELLTVTGRVINPTGREQDVPPLQAQLKTRAGKVVYSWTIAPPARSLAPGASATFNSAEVNVPPGGDEMTITVGSGRA